MKIYCPLHKLTNITHVIKHNTEKSGGIACEKCFKEGKLNGKYNLKKYK